MRRALSMTSSRRVPLPNQKTARLQVAGLIRDRPFVAPRGTTIRGLPVRTPQQPGAETIWTLPVRMGNINNKSENVSERCQRN